MSRGSQSLAADVVLFGEEQGDTAEMLGTALRDGGLGRMIGTAVGSLTSTAQHAVCDEAGRVAADLLRLDLGDVLMRGWAKHSDLKAAGRRTVQEPGSEEVVTLSTHAISSTHRPYVDVRVDDVLLSRVQLAILLSLTVTGLVAVVRDGCLIEVRSGSCRLKGTLDCEGVRIGERATSFALPERLRIPAGLRLVPEPGISATTTDGDEHIIEGQPPPTPR